MSASPRRLGALVAALSLCLGLVTLQAPRQAAAQEPDLAPLGTATASAFQSDRDGTFPPENAIDGDPRTRWASGNGPDDADAEFTATLTVDLGHVASVSEVVMVWEASYATAYDVDVATTAPDQAASWSRINATTGGDGGTDVVSLTSPVQARYVRLFMKERSAATWEAPKLHYYGYSLFSLEVRGAFATPVVSIDAGITVSAGDTATVPVRLSNAAATEQSVRVRSTGGSAVAGTDFTAVDEVVTFAPGEIAKSVEVQTRSQGALAPRRTLVLELSDPTPGIQLAARTTSEVSIRPSGTIDALGDVKVLYDFEDGVPDGFFTWSSRDAVKPLLTTVADADRPGAAADNQVLVATIGGVPTASDWFGFTRDLPASSWNDFDGFQFWFLGTGSGRRLAYEVKSDGKLFDQSVVDDTVGWRRVSVLFTDLREKGNPASPARFNPSAATGFAVTLTGLGAGEWRFDDFALFERALLIDDFETPVRVGEPPVGYFAWGDQEGNVSIGVEQQERAGNPDNHVLAGTYHINGGGGYGGFSLNLAQPQDWSSFKGIRFWWYASQASNPASPTAGADIKVEVKDGGPDAEHSELWIASFKDNWGSSTSRWKLVELPFSAFALRTDYQAGSGDTLDGTMSLTDAWGFAVTLAPGTADPVRWAIDDPTLYGTPSEAADIMVSASPEVTLVDAGETAEVGILLTTRDGEPAAVDVKVDWATGDGTAEAGTDFVAASGSVEFPAGSESGTIRTVAVETLPRDGSSDALVIPITLASNGNPVPDIAPRVVINAHGMAYLDASLPDAERAADLLSRMTLAEKVGQMAQAERLALSSPTLISELGLGSVLSGGGSTPRDNTAGGWARMIDDYQREALASRLQVPIIYGADAVHGNSNLVGATIFPHNIGLGSARDPQLVRDVARATAAETRTTGVTLAFAPCLCVGRDIRWGRIYEAFGEDPALVSALAEPVTTGLQGDDPTDMSAPDEVMASAKHWVGDGGTTYDPSKAGNGYPIDQGITNVSSMAELEKVHVAPYIPAIKAGIGTIMPSYSGVSIDGGPVVRMTENKELNVDLLKDKLGFDGFIISDWEALDKLSGSYADKSVRSVNAGLDMAMAPYNYRDFINAIVAAVESGKVAQSRVDDAVTRILMKKLQLGLFEKPFSDDSLRDKFGGPEHRALARDAAAKTQVLLRNDGALPLKRTGRLYVAGSNADDLGNQMGGWSITWQGGSGRTTEGTTILEGIRQVAPDLDVTYSKTAAEPTAGYDAGLVVVGETPYAEGQGDVGNNGKSLVLSEADRKAIDTVCSAMECTVLVVSGRPQVLTGAAATANAVVASFLPGSEGAGVADVLFGAKPFTGALSMTWPANPDQEPINVGDASYEPAYPYGWGLRTDNPRGRIEALAAELSGEAATAARTLLAADGWAADGTIAAPAQLWPALEALVARLAGPDPDTIAQAALAVSLARDLAQEAVVAGRAGGDAAARIADAEQRLWYGDPVAALKLLRDVAGVGDPVPPSPDPSPSPSPSPSPTGTGTPIVTPTPTVRPTSPSLPSYPRPLNPPYEVPGLHTINGRLWFTTCEPYSQTIRCRTDIWATTVTQVRGRFVQRTGWQFNNLTYLPLMKRSQWAANPLGHPGSWTAADGRRWRTECDTPATGRGGCRSYTWSRVIEAQKVSSGYSYRFVDKWVFNNIVLFR